MRVNLMWLCHRPTVRPLYVQYAKLEEDYGLAKRAMRIYDKATKAVPANEKLSTYQIYIGRAAEIFGVPKIQEIYKQAIVSDGLPEKDAIKMCIKYAELETSFGEIYRARAIYVQSSQLADPGSDGDFWKKWHDFEVQHGNEDTFRNMLCIKRSASVAKNLGFVSVVVQESQKESGILQNQEEIDLPEDVLDEVFGGCNIRKRDDEAENENGDGETGLGALERMRKRMRQGN